jgi:uncharacterized protein involved in type VI secretion and phage assembly
MAHSPDLLDGVYTGIVTSNHDPLEMGRVKLRFPWMDDATESHWARMVQPYAGAERGLFFLPEVGDEVLVMFELGAFSQPLVLGGTWNGKDAPPEPGDPDGSNHHKVIETRSGHTLKFGDEPGNAFIELRDSSLQNFVRWDSKTDSITITAQTGDIIIRAPQGAVNLLAKDVAFNVTDSARRTVGGNESVTAKKSATEAVSNSKTWQASSTLKGSSKTLAFSASQSCAVSGGSASVEATGQTREDAFRVGGATTDMTTNVQVEAKVAAEKADARTWTATTALFDCKQISFDTGAAVMLSGTSLVAKATGQLSLFGASVTLQGGQINFVNCGSINFNPQQPPPPSPTVPGNLIASMARAR